MPTLILFFQLGCLVAHFAPCWPLPRQHLFCAEEDDFYLYHDGLMFVINAVLPNKAAVVCSRVALLVN